MLTSNEIKKQMQQGNIIIKNLSENPLNKPNSCDLRIGNTLYDFALYMTLIMVLLIQEKDQVIYKKC